MRNITHVPGATHGGHHAGVPTEAGNHHPGAHLTPGSAHASQAHTQQIRDYHQFGKDAAKKSLGIGKVVAE